MNFRKLDSLGTQKHKVCLVLKVKKFLGLGFLGVFWWVPDHSSILVDESGFRSEWFKVQIFLNLASLFLAKQVQSEFGIYLGGVQKGSKRASSVLVILIHYYSKDREVQKISVPSSFRIISMLKFSFGPAFGILML